MGHLRFDVKTKNKEIYKILGWGHAKFEALCKSEPGFSGILKQKREDARTKKLCEYTSLLDEEAKKGSIVAIIFGLKALGVNDGSQPVQEEKEDKSKDDTLDLKDCTLKEMKTIKRICEAVDKRRNVMAKKLGV